MVAETVQMIPVFPRSKKIYNLFFPAFSAEDPGGSDPRQQERTDLRRTALQAFGYLLQLSETRTETFFHVRESKYTHRQQNTHREHENGFLCDLFIFTPITPLISLVLCV